MRGWVWPLLTLSACATGGGHALHPLRPRDVPTAPYIEGAAVEHFVGSLSYEDGCLLFRSDDGEHLLPIWPRGTVFNGTSIIFHRPGKSDQPLLIAEQLKLGGERLPVQYAQANFANYAGRCAGTPIFVAVVRPAD